MNTRRQSRLAQAKAGALLAASIIASLLVLAVMFKGVRMLDEGKDWLPGLALTLAATLILWRTAALWAKWFCIGCLALAVRGVFAGLMGAYYTRVGTGWFWVLIGAALMMYALTLRFMHDTLPNALDRVCLAGTVPVVLEMLLSGNPFWLTLAPGLLFVAFAYDRGDRQAQSAGHVTRTRSGTAEERVIIPLRTSRHYQGEL